MKSLRRAEWWVDKMIDWLTDHMFDIMDEIIQMADWQMTSWWIDRLIICWINSLIVCFYLVRCLNQINTVNRSVIRWIAFLIKLIVSNWSCLTMNDVERSREFGRSILTGASSMYKTCWLADCLFDWLIDWLIDWLVDTRLSDCLTGCINACIRSDHFDDWSSRNSWKLITLNSLFDRSLITAVIDRWYAIESHVSSDTVVEEHCISYCSEW